MKLVKIKRVTDSSLTKLYTSKNKEVPPNLLAGYIHQVKAEHLSLYTKNGLWIIAAKECRRGETKD
jgi:hypothetical protein